MLRLNGTQIQTLLFPNKEVKISDFRHLIHLDGDNVLELKFKDNTSLLVLFVIGEIFLEMNVRCHLKIDYMPYSRMDHDIEGDIQTLPYVCRMIKRYGCFTEITVVEPHSERTIELLNDAKIVTAPKIRSNTTKAFYPVPTWLPEIKAQIGFDEEYDHIVFPDKGAAARYKDYGFRNVIVFDKERDTSDAGKGRIIRFFIKEGEVNPRSKCIIIDDLCVFGGTFMACGSELKKLGAKTVVLAVAHLEEAAYDKTRPTILSDDSPVDKVFASTSIASEPHTKVQFMKVRCSK